MRSALIALVASMLAGLSLVMVPGQNPPPKDKDKVEVPAKDKPAPPAKDKPPPLAKDKVPGEDPPIRDLPPKKVPGGRDRPTLTRNAWEVKDSKLYRPHEVVALAGADAVAFAKTASPHLMQYIRYLVVHNYPASMRDDLIGLTSFTMNSLSREQDIIRPAVGGPENVLVRINLRDYDLDPRDWDDFVITSPYFHQDIIEKEVETVIQEKPAVRTLTGLVITYETERHKEKLTKTAPAHIKIDLPKEATLQIGETKVSGGENRTMKVPDLLPDKKYYYDVKVIHEGQTSTKKVYVNAGDIVSVTVTPSYKDSVPVESETKETGRKRKVRAQASWTVSPAEQEQLQAKRLKSEDTAIGKLVALTQSKAPIARADWFIVNALVSPNYYKLLRIKVLRDFENLTFFDNRLAKYEIQATVIRSGSNGLATPVARFNRLLGRVRSATGYWWESYDFDSSIAEKNVINNFLRLGNRNAADAQEFIATGLNGLQYYALTAKKTKDKLIDAGAINVVSDANFPDHEVKNARSCIFCHAKGIQPFKSHFQQHVKDLTSFFVFDKDKHKAFLEQERMERMFGRPNWDTWIQQDQDLYRKAVLAASGREPEVNAQVYKLLWDGYQESDLDLGRIVYEVGLDHATIKALIAVKKDGLNNGTLLQQLAVPPINIRRDQWEEAYPDLLTVATITKK